MDACRTIALRLRGGLLLVLLGLAGCGWQSGAGDEEVADDLPPAVESDVRPKSPSPPAQTLALTLAVGDRFPLLKTVEQQLRQPSPDGRSVNTSASTLEMLLTITVSEIYQPSADRPNDSRVGQKRFEVRYHRVRFEQDLGGRQIHYDSAAPPASIPVEALGYHGLKDNGFQFWIGADNQILEMVGFDAFLDRCLEHVPSALRQDVRVQLAASSGADGIANFVDDSIGLLPAAAVKVGDSWVRTRQVLQPVPMSMNNRYTLQQIDAGSAQVDILGSISPSITYRPADRPTQDVNVTIRGGHTFGSCLVDRRTGLPIESKVRQEMQMQVQLAGGIEFEQQKTTVTTIRAFTEQSPQQPPVIAGQPEAEPAR